MNKFLSIIVPIYKPPRELLKMSIESVIAQKDVEIELILINDGSPDDSGDICDQFASMDSRVKVIHKQNNGVSSARNDGIMVSTGEWIVFLDPDDTIPQDIISYLYRLLHNANADMVFGGYNVDFMNKSGTYYGIETEGIFSDSDSKKSLINALLCRQLSCVFFSSKYNKWRSAPWAKVYKRDFILRSGILFDTSLHPYEDTLFNIMLISKSERIYMINECLYNYRVNNEGVLRSCSYNAVENDLHYLERVSLLLEEFGWEDSEDIINMLSAMLINDVLMRYYCHPCNKDDKKVKIEKLERFINDVRIKKMLESNEKTNLTLSQKATVTLIRRRHFYIIELMGALYKKLKYSY